MTETLATIFGLTADDIVKIIGAIGAAGIGLMGAYAKVLLAQSRRSRRRAFVKIRLINNYLVAQYLEKNPGQPLPDRLQQIIDLQRDDSDSRDYADEQAERKRD